MSNEIDHLKSLHTALIDARNGYEQALLDADGKGLISVFREMMVLHGENADVVAMHLRLMNEPVNDDGSFMSTVHRTVMDIRSLFGGLDDSILPGLVDGEQRMVSYYDEAIKVSQRESAINDSLVDMRQALVGKINYLKALRIAENPAVR